MIHIGFRGPICPKAGATRPVSTTNGLTTLKERRLCVAMSGDSDRAASGMPAGEKKRDKGVPPYLSTVVRTFAKIMRFHGDASARRERK